MAITNELLNDIKIYIKNNYVDGINDNICLNNECSRFSASYSLYENINNLKKRVDSNKLNTWQEALFTIIDNKFLNEVEVYKRAQLSKQLFSKIRSDSNYHPDKDIAIRLCIGLKLNLDETLDLLGKAGYTLSPSIERDLVVRYFIENKEYDIFDIDIVLEEMGFKQFLKY